MSRRMRVAGTLALAWLAGARPGAAQRARPHLGLGASVTLPSGDYHKDQFGEGFNVGWLGLAYVDFDSRHGPLGWRLEFSYGENGANDQTNADASAAAGQPVEGAMHLLGANFDLTIRSPNPSGGARGYLLGGVGMCRATLAVRAGSVTADSSESKFAWNVGGGVTGGGKRAAPFLEIRYTHVATVFDASPLPFFMAIAGVRF